MENIKSKNKGKQIISIDVFPELGNSIVWYSNGTVENFDGEIDIAKNGLVTITNYKRWNEVIAKLESTGKHFIFKNGKVCGQLSNNKGWR